MLGYAIELAITQANFDFSKITPQQLDAACLVALRYSNSLPAWLSPLYRAHQEELDKRLFQVISAEGETENQQLLLVRHLPYSDILQGEFVHLAQRCLKQAIPKNPAVLEALLQLTIRRSGPAITAAISSAAATHRKDLSSLNAFRRQNAGLLLAAWWLLDWQAAWTFLRKTRLKGAQANSRFLEFIGAVRRVSTISSMHDQWPEWISPAATAALIPFLYKTVPAKRERPDGEAGQVTSLDELRFLRDSMVKALVDRDPRLAAQTIRGWLGDKALAQHHTWFRHLIVDAEKRITDDAWTAPKPKEVSEVLFRDFSLIRSLEDFVNYLAALLQEDILEDLHGDSSLVPQLAWQGTKGSGRRPTTEKQLQQLLANVIKPRLGARRIVFAREPELFDAKKPEMRVSTLLPDGEQLHVPFEVKQAHASDLWSAPANQLAKRYMREPTVRYGFYLVGWYGLPTPPHPRSRKRVTSAAELQLALLNHVDETVGPMQRKVIPIVYDLTV